MSAGELQAVLAYGHNQWFKCQQQDGNDKLQGLVGPGTAAEGDQGSRGQLLHGLGVKDQIQGRPCDGSAGVALTDVISDQT